MVADEQSIAGEASHATQSIGGAGGDPERGFDPGDLVGGRYRVERLLGRGGMGEVYQVLDESLGVRLALKTVRGGRAGDARELARLKRELQLARKITHPGICRIYDMALHGAGALQVPFITMELVDGETLAQRLRRRGALSAAEALHLADQLCAALSAAHEAGVIHCDLKSGNILIGEDDRVVITDFGLSQIWAAEGAGAARAGTPAYMAPEQVTGGALSPAVDIYALGVVLHEMISGRLPLASDLVPRWASVIRRCLSVEPGRRFRSPAGLARALHGGRRRRAVIAAGALVALAALVTFGLLARHRAHPATGIQAIGCGYEGPVLVDEYRDRALFERAAGAHRVIDFDDIDTRDGPVAIAADRYLASHGAVLRGSDGQWVHKDFGYPVDYRASSPPNGFAPGPSAPTDASQVAGGHDTDVSFRDHAAEACVSALGVVFVDVDWDFPGEPTGLALYDRRGALIGKARARLSGDGSRQFLGLVARAPGGQPVAVVARAHLVNGNGWPAVEAAEGVVLDDLDFSPPHAP